MKIGLFSDWHGKSEGKKLGGIWDRKLVDGVEVLEQVVNVFDTEKVDRFDFLGDLFHRRYTIDGKLLYATETVLNKIELQGNFIPGNHDAYMMGVSTMQFLKFKSCWNVINEPTVIQEKGLKIVMVPFMKEINEETHKIINSGGDILMMHQLLDGFPFQNDYTPSGKEVFRWQEIEDKFGWILSGHNHKPGKKGKIAQLGSVMQLCFGDEKGERGCWILDTDTDEIKFIELRFPKYITIDSLDEVKDEYNYYRLKVSEDSGIKDIPDNVQIQIVPKEVKIDRLHLGENWSWDNVLQKYVENQNKDLEYLEVGKELLK